MGLNAKPIGKMKSLLTKLDNEQRKEIEAKKVRSKKKEKKMEKK